MQTWSLVKLGEVGFQEFFQFFSQFLVILGENSSLFGYFWVRWSGSLEALIFVDGFSWRHRILSFFEHKMRKLGRKWKTFSWKAFQSLMFRDEDDCCYSSYFCYFSWTSFWLSTFWVSSSNFCYGSPSVPEKIKIGASKAWRSLENLCKGFSQCLKIKKKSQL